MTPAQYEAFYSSVASAVQSVNASLPSGELPFLIGGPAVYQPTSTLMSDFITYVKAQNVELDFLSWHEYGGNVWSDAQALQNKLSSAGLNANLPQFVTEWGFTSANSLSAPTPGQLMDAATYISQGWTELETDGLASVVTPFPFSEDDYVGFYRSMLLPYQQNTEDGQVFPLYNVYQMMALQKSTLVANSGVSGGTSSLFPLATEDSSGVALMVTNTAGSTVTVNLNNLPSAFQQGAFQLTEYLVDGTHSNWAYNQSTSTLQEVASTTEGAASSFSTTLSMAQNSVALLVLTPMVSSGGSNLIQDPGFEASSSLAPYWTVDGGPSGAGVDVTSADAHSGSHAGYIYDASGSKKFVDLSQTVTVTTNTSYTLSGWVDASDTTGGLFAVRTTGGTDIATTALTNTDPGPSTHSADYQLYSVTFNSGSNTSVVVFAGYTTPGTGSFINLDDVSLVSAGSTAPQAPTNLAATPGNGSVSLSWTGSNGATSYNIYRGTSSGEESKLASGVSGTSYTDSSAVNGTAYFYEVTAVNSAGESGRSNEVTATPEGSGGGSNLIQDPGFEASSSLAPDWNVDGGPTSAGVDVVAAHAHSGSHAAYLYDDSGTKKFVDLSQTITVTANTSYTLTGWVDASDTTGGLFGVRTTGGTNIDTSALTNTDPGPSTHGGADYEQYTVTFNSGSNTSVVVFAGYTTPGTASFINLDDVSLVANESTAPPAPTNLAATSGNGSVSLSWTGSSGATSYNIYRGTSSGEESKITTGVSATTYTDSSAVNGTTYFYEVTAVNSTGESGRSNEVKATPASGTGTNLIQDPGFEASSSLAPYWKVDGGPSGAGVDVVAAHAHSGSHAGYIYDDSGTKKFVDLSQTVTVTANTSYTLTGWIDASNTTGSLFGVRTTGGTNLATTALTNTDPGPSTHSADYQQYTVTFNSGSNTSVVVFAGYTTPGTGSFINLDDVSVVAP
jgi:predicted RNase H-related nuclease YkuK (DUF458 family)